MDELFGDDQGTLIYGENGLYVFAYRVWVFLSDKLSLNNSLMYLEKTIWKSLKQQT